MKGSSWDLNQLGIYMNKWNQLWIHANERNKITLGSALLKNEWNHFRIHQMKMKNQLEILPNKNENDTIII
jgi:hypothetical protein